MYTNNGKEEPILTLRPAYFRVSAYDEKFLGWTEGELVEGHAVPLFAFDVGTSIVYAHDRVYPGMAAYDAEDDMFRFSFPEREQSEEYGPVAREVEGRVEKLYPIGAGVWAWEEIIV